MAHVPVSFNYLIGISGDTFANVQAILQGSWDREGHFSSNWTTADMEHIVAADGCSCFRATILLDPADRGRWFNWGVSFTFPDGRESWAVPTEVKSISSRECYRAFQFSGARQDEYYYLTHCRRLGANKYFRPDGKIGIQLAVWAPNAESVEVTMGTIWDGKDRDRTPSDTTRASLLVRDIAGGYIANDSTGIHPAWGPFAMLQEEDGVWKTAPGDPSLANFDDFDHKPYMFRIRKKDGTIAYRTDLYSRCQIGFGAYNPEGIPFYGLLSQLDGIPGCSVVVNPEKVTKYFKEEPPYKLTQPNSRVWPEREFIAESEFWQEEFTENHTVPTRVEDLIIYELHIGALGFGKPGPGTLEDAIALLAYLVDLGINAIELLPMSEFGGDGANWGYATSHYFTIEFSGGGRDQYKFFVKECHRRGIAVILDVVYNHFTHQAERAEYQYDSNLPEQDIYYWYEGASSDYTQPDGGYVDNMSTAYAPRYHEEMVRKMFISSAVALAREFHVDGFRLDQTTSMHSYNRLHEDGRTVNSANIFGAKLLREFSRTLRLFKPGIFLLAEDHSDWDEVTLPSDEGGIGMDARWHADFYHHLAGDTEKGPDYAKLLYMAGKGDDRPLAMDYFAGALSATGAKRIVYNESHDEAGNSGGPFFDPEWSDKDKEYTSLRTIRLAVNDFPLVGETRRYAEARCRFAYGVTNLSAGTPMFLFGEEVGAEHRFKYGAVLKNKEDLKQLRDTSGAQLFRFYSALNRLRLAWPALRSRNIDVIYVDNANRMLAFRRWDKDEEFLIVASLNNHPFDLGYTIHSDRLPDGKWREIFNSDAAYFGGSNIGNSGGTVNCREGSLNVVMPFSGMVVLRHVPSYSEET